MFESRVGLEVIFGVQRSVEMYYPFPLLSIINYQLLQLLFWSKCSLTQLKYLGRISSSNHEPLPIFTIIVTINNRLLPLRAYCPYMTLKKIGIVPKMLAQKVYIRRVPFKLLVRIYQQFTKIPQKIKHNTVRVFKLWLSKVSKLEA